MKIFHCADLHLDSPLSANFNREKAAARRNELLMSFSDLADRAGEEGAAAVIIAGDLFDRDHVSPSAAATVRGVIESHPDITFFYLRGNHDRSGAFTEARGIPENLKLFGEEWTSYELADEAGGRVRITGAELTGQNRESLSAGPDLNPDDINIVVLHGQLTEHGGTGSTEDISMADLSGRHIDYLALGHLHGFSDGVLPPGGTWCYPGCLEGRGFDESGEHGFVSLDIDSRSHTVEHSFVPFARRRFFTARVDITGCMFTYEMQGRILTALQDQGCMEQDMIKVVLEGSIDAECEKNVPYLEQYLGELFYLVKIYDESRISVNYDQYALEQSLKGEFVRLVGGDSSLSQQERAEIIRCGLEALNGEEISI